MNTRMNTSVLWQRKLLALLHDPPDKTLDILGHAEARDAYLRQAQVSAEALQAFDKECDHTAAAADRFPFPKPEFLRAALGAVHHPLGGAKLDLKPINRNDSPGTFKAVQPTDDLKDLPAGEERDRALFFLHWRRWPVESAAAAAEQWPDRLSPLYMPADNRLPDHSVWAHNSIVSALQGCLTEGGELLPAFLIFQLGPVQEYIAQARSTRDLWSGSFLLSWLMAHAIKAVTDRVGPDAVLFPFLRAQPLFDLLHRDELYSKIIFSGRDDKPETLWKRLQLHPREILIPNLPNRFLALVPAEQAEELGRAAAAAVTSEIGRIAAGCWDWLNARQKMQAGWRQRYDAQVNSFPQTTWQSTPWGGSLDQALQAFESFGGATARNLVTLHKLTTDSIPAGERDEGTHRDNRGFAWPYFYALADRLLAARRNLRDFKAWKTDDHQAGTPKDSLSGKEEIVGDELWWTNLRANPAFPGLFKSADRMGAMNLIKRVWHAAYLDAEPWCLDTGKGTQFVSTPEIAGVGEENASGYFAVIAFDGDEMGKWVSGEKMPLLERQVAAETRKYFDDRQIKLANIQRPLSPSWHMQFSEALANFALYLARPVTEAFGGQLIYAGGDDVLAMVPAAQALDCAAALRAAFQGQAPIKAADGVYEMIAAGWVRLKHPAPGQPTWPLLVPGPEVEASVGIAIGHCHSPLQGVVRAAGRAEKRAKGHGQDGLGRAAFAVNLFKRSGEILEWGARWDSGALKLYSCFTELTNQNLLAGKFAYALAELIDPYEPDSPSVKPVDGFPRRQILDLELARVLDRQYAGPKDKKHQTVQLFMEACSPYLDELERAGRNPLQDLPGLFRVANFIRRGDRA